MKSRGYSLIEVLIAAAVMAIGIAAAGALVRGLMAQQEASAAFLRGINLQEQSVRLWQLGLDEEQISQLLPEPCVDSGAPAPGTFHIDFTQPVDRTVSVSTSSGQSDIVVQVTTNTIIYADLEVDGGEQPMVRHQIVAVRPSIR